MGHQELHTATQIVDNAVAHLQRKRAGHEPLILKGEFRDTGRALCIGYAILGSEALDRADIDHKIGFANGHATIILPLENEDYLLDPFSPKLRQRIDDKMLIDHERTRGVTAYWLNTPQAIDGAQTGIYPPDRSSRKYFWLIPPGSPSAYSATQGLQDHDANKNILISVFESELGRRALGLYAVFKDTYYTSKSIDVTAQAIIDLGNSFPEIDMRTKDPKMVTSVVKRLTQSGEINTATSVMNAYFSNFSEIQDSRVDEYRADCLRYIATASGLEPLAVQALALYRRARTNSKSFKRSIEAKERLCDV